MLVVDPRAEWTTVATAVDGVRNLGYASPNMLGYYPRMYTRGDDEVAKPVGGAIAGLLCRHDRTLGPWQDLNQHGMGLHWSLVPSVDVSEDDIHSLGRAGLNILANGSAGRARLIGSLTMGRGSEAHRRFAKLPVRRFCLQIVNTIAAAAKWAVFEPGDRTLAKRIEGQITTYFHCLDDLGAFADNRFVVECDAGVSSRSKNGEHGIAILLVFHPAFCDEPISLTLHLSAAGCRAGSTAFAPSIDDSA